ncbi:MAG: alpha/beta hydrolase [Draconibacterium sp.]|nr:alpha/beta hydrolase [Draconibacterium sp.]
MKKLKITLMILFCALFANFLLANNFYETKTAKINGDEKVRYVDKIFENITIQKDVVFGESVTSTGTKQNLALDIYSPENDNLENRPVIVWIHGGGFRFGNDKTQSYIVEMAKRFALKGFVCLAIDYRLRENPKDDPKGTISDAVEDAVKGLDWLRENGKLLKVDVSKIIIAGGSAGGMLGCNLCFNDRPDNKNDKKGVVAFVDLWGTPDEIWGQLDIDKNDPPTIIVHGTEDKLVSYSNSIQLTEKLKSMQVTHELITIKDAGHTPVKYIDEFEKKIADFLFKLIL